MYYDESISTGKPVRINISSGALTTFSSAYPSFRRFIVDKETMLPMQIETYTLDPEAENPEFVFNHELTEWYGIADLSPSSMAGLSNKFITNSELSMKYLNTKTQNGLELKTECDHTCMLEASCETRSSTWDDERLCRGMAANTWFHDPFSTLMEWSTQPWYKHHVIPRPKKEDYVSFEDYVFPEDEEFDE